MIKRIKNIVGTEERKRLLSNFFSLSILQGADYILPLLTMPYLFRVLGAEKFGLVAFSTSTLFFFNILVEYGFNLSATRDISKNIGSKQKIQEIFATVLTAKLFLLLVSFFLLSLLIVIFDKFNNDWQLFYLSFLLVIGNALLPTWFFQGIEEMKYISYFSLGARLFFTLGIFIFISSPDDYLLQPLMNGGGMILIGIFSIHFVKKKYDIKFSFQSFNKIRRVLKDGLNIFITEFIPNLYSNFSNILLGFFATMEIVGYYSLATKVIDVFNRLIYIVRNITFPYLNKNNRNFKKVAKVTILGGAVLSFFAYSTTYYLVPFIFGTKAYNSLVYIYILAFSPFFMAILQTYGVNKLLVEKQDSLYKKIIITGSLFGFLLSTTLVPFFSAIGASITLISTRGVLAGLVYFKTKYK
ncbi:PST family polysaccharide transporter [Tenacibaculum lutimaris]|uniref:PST family polysaccharide transporter n=1 Tax=Tenacibaculum lutimaris TaxID=285258 RepID=A0A420DYB0_9FLAO|nr:oligosaccharide flippase family protein [Tenacibaculum lutimaris]RKF02816.1 PST family polysaccharide transporter [Tenacibaculum lutimaris]